MLPNVDALFTLVRQLARRSAVTDVAAPKWLVQRHGLAPLAARAGLAKYRDELVRATLEWARIEQELPPLVAALREAGVRACTLKGVSYAKALYASPAERPMSDVDLMVHSDQADRARALLQQLGFDQAKSAVLHHAAPYVRGDFVIDLHWNIIGPGRAHIDLEALWARTVSGWPAGAVQLEDVDALVFHLVHLARNRLRLPLINVVDAARLLEHAAPNAALARAKSWGLHVPVSLALRFCESILAGTPGRPAGWLGPSLTDIAVLAEPSRTSKALFDVLTAGSPVQLASRVAQFGANKLRSIARRQ